MYVKVLIFLNCDTVYKLKMRMNIEYSGLNMVGNKRESIV